MLLDIAGEWRMELRINRMKQKFCTHIAQSLFASQLQIRCVDYGQPMNAWLRKLMLWIWDYACAFKYNYSLDNAQKTRRCTETCSIGEAERGREIYREREGEKESRERESIKQKLSIVHNLELEIMCCAVSCEPYVSANDFDVAIHTHNMQRLLLPPSSSSTSSSLASLCYFCWTAKRTTIM